MNVVGSFADLNGDWAVVKIGRQHCCCFRKLWIVGEIRLGNNLELVVRKDTIGVLYMLEDGKINK